MLEINNLSINIKEHKYLDNFNLVLNKYDKACIIGEEGNGKSTILKAILDKAFYASINGNINTNNALIGYLPQKIEFTGLIYDYLFNSDYEYEMLNSNFYVEANKLNIDPQILYRDFVSLSGGEKVKIGILKLKLHQYDLYLLDEPTNDLDIQTLEILESFINNCNSPILFVSHDETLIQNCANIIIHIEQLRKKTVCKYTIFHGSYYDYQEARNNHLNVQNRQALSDKKEYEVKKEKLNNLINKVHYAQNNVSRQNPHEGYVLKKKMKQLKSMDFKLSKKDLREFPDSEESIDFFFEDVKIPSGKNVLSFELDELIVSDKVLATNIRLHLEGNKHIAIIGKNGCGKSTLIKKIYEDLIKRKDINVGYMPQNYEESFNKVKVLNYLVEDNNAEDITKAMTMLGNMKFTSEEMMGDIKDLSGGLKAKLLLVKLALKKYDVLLLDEPTRNLSPLSTPIIAKALNKYQGAILFVSHDRALLKRCADCIFELNSNGLTQIG